LLLSLREEGFHHFLLQFPCQIKLSLSQTLGGIAIANTGKVIIIATFDEKKQHTSPGCNENVSMLAKYFRESVK
jgi:hypothetical protein